MQDHRQHLTTWLRTLIAAGVYRPGARLPSQRELARVCVSDAYAIRSSCQQLLDEGTLEARKRRLYVPDDPTPRGPTCTLPPLRVPLTMHDHDPAALREAALCTRVWWVCSRGKATTPAMRQKPSRGAVGQQIAHLCTAFQHLARQLAAHGMADTPHARSLTKRAELAARAVCHADPPAHLWYLACLGTAVEDLLHLGAPAADDPAADAPQTAHAPAAGQRPAPAGAGP